MLWTLSVQGWGRAAVKWSWSIRKSRETLQALTEEWHFTTEQARREKSWNRHTDGQGREGQLTCVDCKRSTRWWRKASKGDNIAVKLRDELRCLVNSELMIIEDFALFQISPAFHCQIKTKRGSRGKQLERIGAVNHKMVLNRSSTHMCLLSYGGSSFWSGRSMLLYPKPIK